MTNGYERIPTVTNKKAFIKSTGKRKKQGFAQTSATLQLVGGSSVESLKRGRKGDDTEGTADDLVAKPNQRLHELILLPIVEQQLALENQNSQDYEESLKSWIDAAHNLRSEQTDAREQIRDKQLLMGTTKVEATVFVDPIPLTDDMYPISSISASTSVLAALGKGYLLQFNVKGNQPLARFLNMQFDGFIKFAEPVTASNKNATVLIDPYDTTQMWFDLWLNDDMIAAQTSLSVVPIFGVDLTATTRFVNSFNFQIQVTSSLKLNFSSQPSAIKAGFLVDPTAWPQTLSSQGFLVPSTTLCLGLDSAIGLDTTISLTAAYALMGLDRPAILDGSSQLALDKSAQNSVWFTPGPRMQTVWRVSLLQNPQKATGLLAVAMPNTTITNSRFQGMRLSHYEGWGIVGSDSYSESCVTEGRVIICAQITLNDDSPSPPVWDCFMTTTNNAIELRLQRNSKADESVLTNIVNWISKVCGIDGFFKGGAGASDSTNYYEWLKQLTSNLYIREFVISADHSTGNWIFPEISLSFEIDLTVGLQTSGTTIPVFLKFSRLATSNSSLIQFKGGIWTKVLQTAIDVDRLNPESHMIPYQWPLGPSPQYFVFLPSLFTDQAQSQSFPTGFPQYVTMFNIELNSSHFSFSGAMCSRAAPAATEPSTAPINLTDITIIGTYVFKVGSTPAACSARLQAALLLVPRETRPQMDSARVCLGVAYSRGQWVLTGRTQGLNAGALYAMFPASDCDAVMNALEQISIINFEIVYKYFPANAVDSQGQSKAGTGSDFKISASIAIGLVELDLNFAYGPTQGPGRKPGWQLGAALSPLDDQISCTVGELFGDISPDLKRKLPDLIADLDMTFYKDKTQLFLNIDKATIKNADNSSDVFMIFSLILKAGDLDFEYYQIADSQPSGGRGEKACAQNHSQ